MDLIAGNTQKKRDWKNSNQDIWVYSIYTIFVSVIYMLPHHIELKLWGSCFILKCVQINYLSMKHLVDCVNIVSRRC